jgi:hypothetical protein
MDNFADNRDDTRPSVWGQIKKDVGDFVRGTRQLLSNPRQLIDGTYRGRNTHNASNFDSANFTSPDVNDRSKAEVQRNEPKKAKTPRPSTKSDASVLAAAQRRRGQGRGRGVLASVYRLPADAGRAAKTLQNFNGPQGRDLRLGQ